MKTVVCILFLLAGISISMAQMQEEKEKITCLAAVLDFTKNLCRDVESFRVPMGDILSGYKECGSFKEYFSEAKIEDLHILISQLCGDSGKAGEYLKAVMNGSYDEAVASAKALRSYTQELETERRERYKKEKTAKAVLPITAGLLAGILII